MSNTATIKVALRIDDQGVVRGFRNIGTESEKAGKRGRKSFDDMDQGATGFNNRLVSIKSGIAGLITVLTAMKAVEVFNRINAEGMELESTMKRVGAVSRANLETYEKLEAAARQAGATTEWQAKEAAKALQFEAMAGMEAQNAIQGLPDLLDLATASQVDLGIASDIVTDNLTAFGMQISELSRLNDAFINTTTRSNTTVQMLGESFKYTAPVAAQMGYSVEQTAAFLGVMANSGIKASDAGTDLRQILLRIADAAEELGLGAGATLIDVLEKMHDRQMSANEVTDLFGILASKSAMVLMNNVEAYKKLNREIEESEGATKALAEQVRDSAENDWKVMISAITETGLKMYDMYEADYRSLIRGITDAVNENADGFKSLAEAIGGVITALDGVVRAGSWTLEKAFRPLEIASLNAKALGMATAGLFSADLIGGTSFDELKQLVELGEKAMSSDFLEMRAAQAELLRMEIDQLEKKLTASIFYPQGAKEDLAAMKADYAAISAEVRNLQTRQKDAQTLDRLADTADALDRINKKLAEETKALAAVDEAWAKDARVQSIKDEEEARSNAWDEYITQMNEMVAREKEAYEFLTESRVEGIREEERARQEAWQNEIEQMNDVIAQEKKAYEKSLKERERANEQMLNNIQDATADFLYDLMDGQVKSWSDLFSTIFDYFKKLLAQMAAEAIANPIIVPIVQDIVGSISKSIFGTAAGTTQTSSGGSSIFGPVLSQELFSGYSWGDVLGSALTGYFTGPTITSLLGLKTSEYSDIAGAAGSIIGGYVAGPIGSIVGSFLGSAIAGLFGSDDPDPRVSLFSGVLGDASGSYAGEIDSLSGFNYHTWLQDIDGRDDTGEAVIRYFDAVFTALDDAVSISVKDVLAGSYFQATVNPEDWSDDAEGMFEELLRQIFEQISGNLVTAVLGADAANYFDSDFFTSIQEDGEDLFTTFARFESVVTSTDDFMYQFGRQVYELGKSTTDAYNDLATIITTMEEIRTGVTAITDVSSISALQTLTESWEELITTLKNAGATTEDLAEAEKARLDVIGANLTGLTADALVSALSNAGDVDSILEQAATDAAYASIAQTIADKYFTGINDAIAQVWDDTGSVSAVVAAMREIDTTAAQTELNELRDAFGLVADESGTTADSIDEVADSLTGLTEASMATALKSGKTINDMLTGSIESLAYDFIAQTLMDKYVSGWDTALTAIWDSTGDIGAVVAAMGQIDTTAAQAELEELQEAFGLLAEEADTSATALAEAAQERLDTATDNLETALENEISSKQAELTTLQGNLDTARNNYLAALDNEIETQEEARDAAEKSAETFRDLADALAAGKLDILSDFGGDPAQSVALAKELYEAAVQGAWNKDEESLKALPDLATAYLEASKQTLSAVEFNDLTAAVYRQLSTAESIAKVEAQAQDEVANTAQDQIDTLQATRDEVAGAASTLLSIEAAADDYYEASLALEESGLEQEISTLEAQLAELQALNSNIMSLAQARTEYNAAQTAVEEASSSYTFNDDIYYANKAAQLNANLDDPAVQAAAATYNHSGVWTVADVQAAFSQAGLTAQEHYERYGGAEGVSPYTIQSVGYAEGGIASGPANGYYELLHGTEAIIPLGRGNIPLIIQDNGYGDRVVQEVVQFREKMDEYLFSIAGDLKTLVGKFEKWDRYGVKIKDAA